MLKLLSRRLRDEQLDGADERRLKLGILAARGDHVRLLSLDLRHQGFVLVEERLDEEVHAELLGLTAELVRDEVLRRFFRVVLGDVAANLGDALVLLLLGLGLLRGGRLDRGFLLELVRGDFDHRG